MKGADKLSGAAVQVSPPTRLVDSTKASLAPSPIRARTIRYRAAMIENDPQAGRTAGKLCKELGREPTSEELATAYGSFARRGLQN